MNANILLIEDHYDNTLLMVYLLVQSGHHISSADTGEEGLEMALSADFDLILCDIRMPGMDGYEVARRMKSNPQLHNVPLIAITAQAMAGDREKILASGFDGYLSKPISPHSFIQQIESFLTPVPAKNSFPQTVVDPEEKHCSPSCPRTRMRR